MSLKFHNSFYYDSFCCFIFTKIIYFAVILLKLSFVCFFFFLFLQCQLNLERKEKFIFQNFLPPSSFFSFFCYWQFCKMLKREINLFIINKIYNTNWIWKKKKKENLYSFLEFFSLLIISDMILPFSII